MEGRDEEEEEEAEGRKLEARKDVEEKAHREKVVKMQEGNEEK